MGIFRSNAILRIASVALFFSIWQIFSLFINIELLPSPAEVLSKILEEAKTNELYFHTFVTLKRVFISFFIAMFVGTFFGIYMGRSKKLNVFLDDWLVLGLNVPALVIIILCHVYVVWFPESKILFNSAKSLVPLVNQ